MSIFPSGANGHHIFARSLRRDVVQVATHVDQVDGGAVAVQVDQGPQGPSGVHPRKEDAPVLAIDAEMNVSVARDGKVDEYIGLGRVPLAHGLGPVSRHAGQVGAGVLGQSAQVSRVVGGEAHPDDPVPSGAEIDNLQIDSFSNGYWSVTEQDSVTKALDSSGSEAFFFQSASEEPSTQTYSRSGCLNT